MTPQEAKELNERMLKKIGFTFCVLDGVRLWSEPNEKCYCWRDDKFDLLHDLNACVKWLVPVLRKQGCEVVSFFYNLKNIDCDLTPANHATATIEASADTESMALCLAADKFLR